MWKDRVKADPLENFCGSLLALSEFLKIFKTTCLGKGSHFKRPTMCIS
jgi:hypothetical protein